MQVLILYHIYVNIHTTRIPHYDHPLRIHPCTTLYTKILPNTIIHRILINAHHKHFQPVQSYMFYSLRADSPLAQENIRRIIHKNLPRLHTISGCNPVPSTGPGSWGTSPTLET